MFRVTGSHAVTNRMASQRSIIAPYRVLPLCSNPFKVTEHAIDQLTITWQGHFITIYVAYLPKQSTTAWTVDDSEILFSCIGVIFMATLWRTACSCYPASVSVPGTESQTRFYCIPTSYNAEIPPTAEMLSLDSENSINSDVIEAFQRFSRTRGNACSFYVPDFMTRWGGGKSLSWLWLVTARPVEYISNRAVSLIPY